MSFSNRSACLDEELTDSRWLAGQMLFLGGELRNCRTKVSPELKV